MQSALHIYASLFPQFLICSYSLYIAEKAGKRRFFLTRLIINLLILILPVFGDCSKANLGMFSC